MDISEMIYAGIEWDRIVRRLQEQSATLTIHNGKAFLYDSRHCLKVELILTTAQDFRLTILDYLDELKGERSQ